MTLFVSTLQRFSFFFTIANAEIIKLRLNVFFFFYLIVVISEIGRERRKDCDSYTAKKPEASEK